jgi:hypothetical protein
MDLVVPSSKESPCVSYELPQLGRRSSHARGEYSTPPVPGPYDVSDPNLLDRDSAIFRFNATSRRKAAVTARTQALDVLRAVGPEHLAFDPVRPADERAAARLPEPDERVVRDQPGRPVHAGLDAVTERRRDDRGPVPAAETGDAGGPLDVRVEVGRGPIGLARAAPALEHPDAPLPRRRDLVGERPPLPCGGLDPARIRRQPLGERSGQQCFQCRRRWRQELLGR